MMHKSMTRKKLYSKCQKAKHHYNTHYVDFMSGLSTLQRVKIDFLCKKLGVELHQLRDKEINLVTKSKSNIKKFNRVKKHKGIYNSLYQTLTL